MKVKSANNPTTGDLAVGKDTLHISELDNISTSMDRVFDTVPATGFTVNTLTGFSLSNQQGGMKLTKNGGTSQYSITHSSSINEDMWAFDTEFEVYPDIPNMNVDVIFQRFRVQSSGSDWYQFDVRYDVTDSCLKIMVLLTEGPDTYQEVYRVGIEEQHRKSFTLQLIKSYSFINLYIVDHDSNEWRMIHGIDSTLSGSVNITLSSTDLSSDANCWSIWKRMRHLPALFGPYGFNTDLQYRQLPVCIHRGKEEASFTCFTSYLTQTEFMSETSGTGASSSFSIPFLCGSHSRHEPEDLWSFMVSPVERLHVEGDYKYECPSLVSPDFGSVGNILINVDCCFPDGTTRSIEPFLVKGGAFGKVLLDSDTSHSPKFFVEDHEGVKYGCAFEFKNLIQHQLGDNFLGLDDNSFRISFLRSKGYGKSKRVFYGIQVDPLLDTFQNFFAEITYFWSEYQLENMGEDRDLYSWRIIHEDGSVIQTSGPGGVSVSNYLVNKPLVQPLQQGRYILEVSCLNENIGYVLGRVFKGSTANLDNLMGQVYAGAADLNTSMTSIEIQVSRLHFEVREEFGYLVAYIFDPLNKTSPYTKKELFGTNVDLEGTSLGCFEIPSGDLVFIYKKKTDNTSYRSHSNKLYYRCLSATTGLFLPEGVIELPISGSDLSYIHSFDVGRVKNNRLEIIASVGTNDAVKRVNGVQRFLSCSPMGESLVKFDISIRNQTFTGNDIIVNTFSMSKIPMSSVNNLWRGARPDMFFDENPNLWERGFFADTVRVTRNEEQDIDVVSIIDVNTRTPVVLIGNRSSYKEIAVPFHFDSKFHMEEEIKFGGLAPHKHVSLRIDSLSATLGHDGMVYSASTQGDICEIGVIDPSIYWSPRPNFVNPQIIYGTIMTSTSTEQQIDIYRPAFRFEGLQTLSLGFELEVIGKTCVDINTHQHYMALSVGNNRYLSYPMVYQNGMLDEVGFEASIERVIVGGHGNDIPTWIDHQAVIFQGEDKIDLKSIGNDTHLYTYLYMKMQDDMIYQHQHLKLEEGYRFSTRVGCTPLGLATSLDRPFYLICQGYGYHDPTDLNSPLLAGVAQIQYTGDSVEYSVYNSQTSSLDVVKTVALDASAIYDFEVIMKRVSFNKVDYGFIIKKPRYLLKDNCHEFANDLVDFHFEKDRGANMSSYPEEYQWGWVGGANVSGDINEYLNVYDMGYGLLKQSNGVNSLYIDDKGGSPYTVFKPNHFDASIGRWRDFNDVSVFTFNGDKPAYYFRAGFFNSSSQSSLFHFPNGFLWKMNRGVITPSDEWTIQRKILNNVKYLLSKFAPGFWVSTNESDVIIYAKAEDSGLDYFDIDTIVIQGANFCECELVVRNTDVDPWTVIKTLRGDVLHLSGLTPTNDGEYGKLELSNGNLGDGFEQSQDWYYKERVSGIVCKIVSVQNNTILLKLPSHMGPLTETEGTIFSSLQLFEIEEDSTKFVQVGIKLGHKNNTYDNLHLIHTIDFGTQRRIPLIDNHDIGGGSSVSMRSNVKEIIDKNTPFFNPDPDDRVVSHEFSFTWTLLSSSTYAKVLSTINNVKYNSVPMWVINSQLLDRRVARLCYVSSPFSHQVVVDEDDTIRYNVKTTLKGIE